MAGTSRSLTASYAVRFIAKFPPHSRLPRPAQSEAANRLLADLRREGGQPDGASSKAHARTAIAVAVTPTGRIGIDIEYRAPDRPIRDIARLLMNETPADDAAAYRVFTFHEAWFKAFGEMAGAERLRAVAGLDARLHRMADGVNVLHEAINADFVLTLVWDGAVDAVRLAAG